MANDNTMPDFGAFSPTNPNPTADTEKEEACTGTENARTKKETTAAIKSFGEKEKAGVEDKIVIYQYSEEQNGLDMDEENDEDPAGRAWHENIRLRDEQSVVEKVEQELKERPVHCLVVVAGKQKSGMQIRMITKDNYLDYKDNICLFIGRAFIGPPSVSDSASMGNEQDDAVSSSSGGFEDRCPPPLQKEVKDFHALEGDLKIEED